MKVFKIPHKWWHFFFTTWTSSWVTDFNDYTLFKCTRCRKEYEFKTPLIEYETVRVK